MTTTTANKIRGRSATFITFDDWATFEARHNGPPLGYDSYVMSCHGKKCYAFYRKTGGGAVARYQCSHVEAQRRFKMLLITTRLACA